MNALEEHGVIRNGTIVNNELARKFWQKMRIEIVITGWLDPRLNETRYKITLLDAVNGNKMNNRDHLGSLQLKGTTTRGSQSSELIKTSQDNCSVPIPSAEKRISQHFLNSHEHKTLADVGKTLETALKNVGFKKTAYFLVPEGFALVSSADEFEFSVDGTPMQSNAIEDNFFRFFKNYIKVLFLPEKPNAYQVVCVIVTSGEVFYQQGKEKMSFKKAEDSIGSGALTIPNDLKNKEYNEKEYECRVLLYVYDDKKNPSGDKINIRERLQNTGFWE
ncbi:MAG: hypothetical protein D3922_01640 [Candidatus Electrothrix sp. AR1]|nr:hypothetical protein [Candidatus Electrothrix sp. AR1]